MAMGARGGGAGANSAPSKPVAENKPRDARIIEMLLQTVGIHDSDDQVVPMLLEFAYRYVSDVLGSALVCAEHAARSEIQVEDVKLAVADKVSHSFTAPPPKALLLELASEKNSVPLPLVTEHMGIRLPPPQYTLTNPNYIVSVDKPSLSSPTAFDAADDDIDMVPESDVGTGSGTTSPD